MRQVLLSIAILLVLVGIVNADQDNIGNNTQNSVVVKGIANTVTIPVVPSATTSIVVDGIDNHMNTISSTNGQGVCPSGQKTCNGTCVDTSTDPNNCGACGIVCDSGSCSEGICKAKPCPSGQKTCDGTCVDTSTDPNNCGACGYICQDGKECKGGTCVCPDGKCCPGCTGGSVCVPVNGVSTCVGSGSISIVHNGGYVASASVTYTDASGAAQSQSKDGMTEFNTYTFNLPAGATGITVTADENWGFGWKKIFTLNYATAATKCIRISGTTLKPSYQEMGSVCG